MKFNTVRFVVIFFGILQSVDGYGQRLRDTQVSVVFRQVPLRQVLDYLEREADVKFVYSTSHLDLDERVDINMNAARLDVILDALLATRGIRYIPQEGSNFIVLASAPTVAEVASRRIIQGHVLSAGDNLPLSSVSVVVRGTTRGAITDAGGSYKLEAAPEDVLVFTYIGFERLEVPVATRSVVDVSLKEDVSDLHEVLVNAGYWQTPEGARTGNITKVTAEQIASQPVSNALQALQGSVPGVYITQVNGVPGGMYTVEIRGRNSIRADANDPLYIIDGVPYTSLTTHSIYTPGASLSSSPMNSINPGDIESIEILKDADATAIYGSRGANGVILITTKRGRTGATQVTMNVYSGVGQVARQLDLLNTQQWLEMRKEAFKNDKLKPTISNAPDLLVLDTTRYTDWQKELIGGSAGIVNGQFSIGGGDERTQFNLGSSYRRESTVFPGDFSYQRGSGHLNLKHTTENRKLQLSFTTEFVGEENELPQNDITTQANTTLPLAPAAFDSLGNLSWVTPTNPYADLYRTYGLKSRNLITNGWINYTPVRDLQFRANLGYTMYRGRETGYEPIRSYNPSSQSFGRSRLAITSIERWIAEPQVEYTRFIGQGKFNVLGGMTFLQDIRQVDAFIGSGYTSDALLTNLKAAPIVEADLSDYAQYRYMAVFGRLHYSWRDKYLINLTGRRDGSSRFGPDQQFANFGAVGVAWIFSEENFSNQLFPYLSFGKLRASYGITGSDQIGDYQYMRLFGPTNLPYEGAESIVPTRLVNPDFAWESNRKLEVSADLGFIQDRIQVSASWYHHRSGNQLVGYPLPSLTGVSSVQANLDATVENTGWEFSVRTTNIHGERFSWTTTANLTVPRNRLVSYPGLAGSSYANVYEVGKPLYVVRRYHATGVNPETGLYTFEDVDDDGSLTVKDFQGLKEVSKQYYGGIYNTLRYRGWGLDFMFQFVRQTGVDLLSYFVSAPGSRNMNQPAFVMNRWQKPGDRATVQRFTTSSSNATSAAYATYKGSDANFSDASFIRLRSVSLSWQLPVEWTRRLGLQRAQLYGQGQNVLTFTDYQGRDPEAQGSGYVPPLRVFTLGVTVAF